MTEPDPKLLEATIDVLAAHGWTGLTLERVAKAAGVARPTLWRQGVTRESLAGALLERLARSYREAMWPAVVSEGPARERLERALDALFDVADEHLPLLVATDTAFHEAGRTPSVPATSYVEPLARLLQDGVADGSIRLGDPGLVQERAVVLFNLVWTYVHLRARHGWSTSRTRSALLPVALGGLVPPEHADRQ